MDNPVTTVKGEYICNDSAQFPAPILIAVVSLDSFAAAQILGSDTLGLSAYLKSSFNHRLFRAGLGAFYTRHSNTYIYLQ